MLNKENIEKLALERINELDKGLFIVDISISPKNVIQVELDCEDGNVAILDCVSVSRNIEHNLDREEQDFELSVSSAGLDRPFRVLKQYYKNIGQEVKVLLKEKNQSLEGVLTRSEEHTSELQSRPHLVCRLLLEKKKKQLNYINLSTNKTLLLFMNIII